ncbi:hypothetical protein [Nocardia iowensis]|uniref:DinB family protein n=1 Tax=Nocardia iowensis TaxID=204891 RepID=A0ABX8RGV0_NOCIO|nr:hypothetical protein [Nocardia iowensis]QXN88833.1 hypothetical protein KV110_24990 [Nocardia iowensis]
MLTALAGQLSEAPELLGWARELGDLHASLIPGTVDPDRRQRVDVFAVHAQIADLEAEINSWAVFNVPRPSGARRHTHSFGEVISHAARTYAHVGWTIRHAGDQQETPSGTEQKKHDAWFHLAEVVEGYVDLVNDVAAGLVQLPLGWRGARPLDVGPSK